MDKCTIMHHSLATTLISDVAICITMPGIANDLPRNRCPCRAGVYHTCPEGKHGCVISFHLIESTSESPAKVQGIQVAVPHNTLSCKTTVKI